MRRRYAYLGSFPSSLRAAEAATRPELDGIVEGVDRDAANPFAEVDTKVGKVLPRDE